MGKQPSADRALADTFRTLLTEHFALASSPVSFDETRQFKELLEGFGNAYDRATKTEADDAKRDRGVFEAFFPAYDKALERWREEQEDRADDLNLLDVMQVTWKEIRHSRILAWLMDWDMTRLGIHVQGRLGFRLFLEQVGLPAEYAAGDYRVYLESPSDESRIDIEVAERGRFVIHIENKIGADEGYKETEREWRDLEKRAEALGCAKKHAFYLTPKGIRASCEHFQPISWRQIAAVFKKFADAAKPDDVKLFARHYARVLRTTIIPPDIDEKESDDARRQV